VRRDDILADARRALAEDIGKGDLSAVLIPPRLRAVAEIVCKSPTVLCGRAWASACFQQLDAKARLRWFFADGDCIGKGALVCEAHAAARAMLAAERSALNFLQTLSATAAQARHFVTRAKAGGAALVVDTRKTIPGLRRAQKYAVKIGGATNHREGLFDEILIKENHIKSAGGVAAALTAAQANAPHKKVQIEVENEAQLKEALAHGARRILLDNFTPAAVRRAVAHSGGRAELEASGGITPANIAAFAASGIDRISVGAITKDLRAADFSLRIVKTR
jgi:nicotinate-nucleotide pyrophosphorylase (carboxylating)